MGGNSGLQLQPPCSRPGPGCKRGQEREGSRGTEGGLFEQVVVKSCPLFGATLKRVGPCHTWSADQEEDFLLWVEISPPPSPSVPSHRPQAPASLCTLGPGWGGGLFPDWAGVEKSAGPSGRRPFPAGPSRLQTPPQGSLQKLAPLQLLTQQKGRQGLGRGGPGSPWIGPFIGLGEGWDCRLPARDLAWAALWSRAPEGELCLRLLHLFPVGQSPLRGSHQGQGDLTHEGDNLTGQDGHRHLPAGSHSAASPKPASRLGTFPSY